MIAVQVVLLALWIPLFKCAMSNVDSRFREDPLLEYFLKLQKTVTDGDGRLKSSVTSFPAAVFGLTDCGEIVVNCM